MGTDQVLLFLEDVRERLKIVHPTEDDYYSAISAPLVKAFWAGLFTTRCWQDAH